MGMNQGAVVVMVAVVCVCMHACACACVHVHVGTLKFPRQSIFKQSLGKQADLEGCLVTIG